MHFSSFSCLSNLSPLLQQSTLFSPLRNHCEAEEEEILPSPSSHITFLRDLNGIKDGRTDRKVREGEGGGKLVP